MLALYQPDIPQNAGTMLRMCACLGVDAAIVGPAGFPTDDRHFRRSGMDYLDHVALARHASFEDFEDPFDAGLSRAPVKAYDINRIGTLANPCAQTLDAGDIWNYNEAFLPESVGQSPAKAEKQRIAGAKDRYPSCF